MVISPPRINLRRAASYNHDRGPLSATSSRFNFNHLVFSPPPSPGLPSLSPPPRKPSRGLTGLVRPSRILRYTVWLIGLLVIYYLAGFALSHGGVDPPVDNTIGVDDEAAAQGVLPDFPTPIVVTGNQGRKQWTVYIPEAEKFPLNPERYLEMCSMCQRLSSRLHWGSDSTDPTFIDVREAQEAGHLPKPVEKNKRGKQLHEIDVAWRSNPGPSHRPVCSKSLTFVLESADAGLGNAIMLLWMAYGLAQKEKRAFFIDDTRWAYGRYKDIFQPPPVPSCSAPPKQEAVPCPRQARHLVASAATADELFSFLSQGQSRQRSEFDLARQGHDALFRLIKEDSEYVDRRARDLMAKRIVPRTKGMQNGVAIGTHIRRGDRHPLEPKYRHSYIPLSKYAEAARAIVEEKFNTALGAEDAAAKRQSFLIVASDDPTVYESGEFAGSTLAQDRIKLASKQEAKQQTTDRHVMRKFIDENFGWEGGFFAPMFWNLGKASANAAGGKSAPSPEKIKLRSLVGRAYMMDLAVLADASDAVVCTASSAGCRLLAVMRGWDSAMERSEWINVDGGSQWTGLPP